MSDLIERNVDCPYCGENIDVLVDQSESLQDYIEDCQVCCRPIRLSVAVDLDGNVNLTARSENE